ncbi:nuclease and tudor domain-containing protein [Cyclospora cayetanensis]|uniref:Nuclease and tudor domain-containing protein n=1 Tax=Cyclospora cayetanensis TaxID=88456 RepID=A0A1D3CUT3_9EIME|nr:nuclease and tudor domain-containing protein [Cyclospora cayetanensis]
MASGVATVKEVISGDTLVLVGAPKGGPPPEKRVGLSSVIAPRVALKSLTHESSDEPYGWPAREFMRSRLVGQQVQFKVEYAFNGKEYACVMLKGENVACELLRRGLAKLRDSRNPPNAHDLEELERCEAEAKSKQLGLFSADPGSSTVRQITWAVGDASFVSAFAEKHRGEQLPAIVEYIRDGGNMRVAIRLSPEGASPASYAYCAVSLSGLQCPGTKRDADGNTSPEPFAAEARFFVEIRLLNRDVMVRIEGNDDFGNILGTIIHPNGEIGLLLLSNGFARINNATAQLTEAPAKLRQAMKDAQTNRLRRWKDIATPSSSDSMEKVYAATVEEVVSGDSVVLLLPSGESRRVFFASLRCLRPGNANKAQSREDEAIALEAKELVRKKTIGKTVFLEYVRAPLASAVGGASPPASDSKGNMHFVSLYIGSPKLLGIPEDLEVDAKISPERRGQNVSELLLQAGLARTVPHRAEDDQAERYDQYQALEKEAQAAKRGCFAPPTAIKVVRIVDLVGPANTQRAIAHLQQLQRHSQVDAIVESAFNAARFKLRIPSQSLCLSFVLSGIRCPQTARPAIVGGPKERKAEPFGTEALQFTRERVLQRDIQVQVEQCDRGGNFIGSLFYGPKRTNLAAELLEAGLAQTVEFSLARAACKDVLEAAEAKAKAARKNLWGLPGALDEEADQEEQFMEKTLKGVVVSHVQSCNCFYIQDEGTEELGTIASEIEQLVGSPPSADATFTPAGLPRKGEVILGQHAEDGNWYRARVENREGQRVSVLYIDYGQKESLPIERMRRCPAAIGPAAIPPQATLCVLSGLLPPPDLEFEAAEALQSLTAEGTFHCLIEGLDNEKRRRCVLTAEADYAEKRPSVNEKLLSMGLALFDRKSNCKFASRFAAEEQSARKAHLNVWRYGDIGAEDDDEDYPTLATNKRAPGRRAAHEELERSRAREGRIERR